MADGSSNYLIARIWTGPFSSFAKMFTIVFLMLGWSWLCKVQLFTNELDIYIEKN